MGLSGFAGAAASQNLEKMLADQLRMELEREQMAALQQEREANRAFRERDFDLRERDFHDAQQERQRQRSAEDKDAAAKADAAAYRQTARANMSELIDNPQQMAAFSLASGEDVPSFVAAQMKPKELSKLVPLDVSGKGGKKTRIMVREDDPRLVGEGIELHQEPRQGPQPQYETVQRGADAQGRPIFVERVRGTGYQEGDLPISQVNLAGEKLSSLAKDKLVDVSSAGRALGAIESAFPTMKANIGPVAGRTARAGQQLPGANKELATFHANLAQLKNKVIKATTGAGMSDSESARIAAEVPDDTTQPEVFEARMEVTRANLAEAERRIYELHGMTPPRNPGTPPPGGGAGGVEFDFVPGRGLVPRGQ